MVIQLQMVKIIIYIFLINLHMILKEKLKTYEIKSVEYGCIYFEIILLLFNTTTITYIQLQLQAYLNIYTVNK